MKKQQHKPSSRKKTKPAPKGKATPKAKRTAKQANARKSAVKYETEEEWIGTDCAAAGSRMEGRFINDAPTKATPLGRGDARPAPAADAHSNFAPKKLLQMDTADKSQDGNSSSTLPKPHSDRFYIWAGKFLLQSMGKLKTNDSEEPWETKYLEYFGLRTAQDRIRFGLQYGSQEGIIEGIKRGELFSTFGYPFKLVHTLIDRLWLTASKPDEDFSEKLFKKQETAMGELASIIGHFITKLPKDTVRSWVYDLTKLDGFKKRWAEIIPQTKKNNRHNLKFVLQKISEFDLEAGIAINLHDQMPDDGNSYIADIRKRSTTLADALQRLIQCVLWRDELWKDPDATGQWISMTFQYHKLRSSPSIYAELVMPFIGDEWTRYVSEPENEKTVRDAHWFGLKEKNKKDVTLHGFKERLLSCADTVLEAYHLNPIPMEQEEWFLDKFSKAH